MLRLDHIFLCAASRLTKIYVLFVIKTNCLVLVLWFWSLVVYCTASVLIQLQTYIERIGEETANFGGMRNVVEICKWQTQQESAYLTLQGLQ